MGRCGEQGRFDPEGAFQPRMTQCLHERHSSYPGRRLLRRRRSRLRARAARNRVRPLAPRAAHTGTATRIADARRPCGETRKARPGEDGEGVSTRRASGRATTRPQNHRAVIHAYPAPLPGVCAALAGASQARGPESGRLGCGWRESASRGRAYRAESGARLLRL